MKLLEIIVKNVKREDIPSSAKWFVQDRDGEFKSSEANEKPKGNGNVWIRKAGRNSIREYLELSSDWSSSIIAREELMRAYDLVGKGYTLWFGGDCPVDGSVFVDVAIGNLNVKNKRSALWGWSREGKDGGIIAYKVSNQIINPSIEKESIKTDSDELIRLISSVAPNITLSDALEIADTLIDAGYHN